MSETTGKKPKAGSSNFGSKGWFIILISIVYFYLSTAVTSDGLNVINNYLVGKFSVSMSSLTIFATAGGWLTLVSIPLFTKLANAKGAKSAIISSLVIFIFATYFIYHADSLIVYGIAMTLGCMAVVGFSMVGTGLLGANWFPTKKGLYMGWATFGIPISAASVSIMQQTMINTIGFENISWFFIGIAVLTIIVTFFFVKNNPEEAGAFPANDQSMTKEKAHQIWERGEELKRTSPWDASKVLHYSETWKIAIGWGVLMMGASGIIAQFVTAAVTWGHDIQYPIMLLTVMFPVGLFFSWFAGYLDDKFGVKNATFFIAGLLCFGAVIAGLFGSNAIALAVGGGCFMGAMSGGNNLTMSVTGSKFGRYDFNNAWAVISVITRIISSTGIILVSLIADKFGYTTSYLAVAVTVIIASFVIKATDVTCVGRSVVNEEE